MSSEPIFKGNKTMLQKTVRDYNERKRERETKLEREKRRRYGNYVPLY